MAQVPLDGQVNTSDRFTPQERDLGRRRSLNALFLLATIGPLAGVAVGAFLLHRYQVRKMAGAAIQLADQLEEDGQYAEAARHIGRYVMFFPDDVRQCIRLAEVFDKSVTNPLDVTGQQQVVALYQRTVGVAELQGRVQDANRLRKRLVHLLMEQRQFSVAERHASEVVERSPRDAEGWRLFALALSSKIEAGGKAEVAAGKTIAGVPCQLGDVLARALELNHADSKLPTLLAEAYRGRHELFSEPLTVRLSETANKAPEDGKAPGDREADPQKEKQQRARDADRILDRAVEANLGNVELLLARHEYRKKYDLPGAEADLDAAITAAPDNPEVLLKAGRRAQQAADAAGGDERTRQLRAAEGCFRRITASRPKTAVGASEEETERYRQAYIRLGQVAVAQGNPSRAAETLREGLVFLGREDLRLNLYLADALVEAHEPEAAEGVLKTLDAALKTQGPWLQRDSRLALNRSQAFVRGKRFLLVGQIAESIRELRAVAIAPPSTAADSDLTFEAWRRLGVAYSLLEQWDVAAAAFESALAIRPANRETLMAAGTAWENANQPQKAIDHYLAALSGGKEGQLWLALARVHLRHQSRLPSDERDWSNAERCLQKAAEAAASGELAGAWKPVLLRLEYAIARSQDLASQPPKGAVLLQFPLREMQTWALHESHSYFLRKLFPDLDVPARCRDALRSWNQSGPPPPGPDDAAQRLVVQLARVRLSDMEKSSPNDPALDQQAALFYERLGDSEKADAALRRLSAGNVDPLTVVLMRAAMLAGRTQYAQARQLLDGQATRSEQERATVTASLVELAQLEGTVQSYQAVKRRLARQQPEGPYGIAMAWRLARLALSTRQFQEAANWELQLQQGEGQDGVLWRSVKAERLLRELEPSPPNTADRRYLEARSLLNDLQRQRPDWPHAWLLQATLHRWASQWPDAVEAYEKAVALGADDIVVYQELVGALCRLNRFQEADRYLSRIQPAVLLSDELSQLAMSVSAALGRRQSALELARRHVEEHPRDPMSWVWQSQMFLLDGQEDEAERAMRKALELGPDDLAVLNARFAFLVRRGQLDAAERTLRKICDQGSFRSQAERMIVEAQGYESLGKEATAKELYLRAVTGAHKDVAIQMMAASFFATRDPATAEKLLRRVLTLAPDDRKARRQLASLLMSKSDGKSWDEAGQVLDKDDHSDHARRLRAMLTVERGGGDIAEAQQILERLLEESPNDDDRFLLANVYVIQSALEFSRDRREGKLALARKQYEWLASRVDPKPAHLMRYIDFLIRYDSREAAAAQLPELKTAVLADTTPKAAALIRYTKYLLDTGFADQAAKPLDELEPLLQDAGPDHQGFYVDLRLLQGSPKKADRWIRQLERSQPRFLTTVSRKARWLKAVGQTNLVQPLVDGFANQWLQQQGDQAEKARLSLAVGRLCWSLELPKAAEKWFLKLREYEPTNYEPLARLLGQQSRTRELNGLCSEVSMLDATSRPMITLARCLALGKTIPRQDAESAEAMLQQAMEEHPRDAGLICAVASLRRFQARYREALSLYKDALQWGGNDAEALAGAAFLEPRLAKSADEALKHATLALRLEGPKAELLAIKGMAYVLGGRPQDGADLLKAAASTVNASPSHQFYYALALARSGDVEAARSLWQATAQNDLQATLPPCDHGLLAELKQRLQPNQGVGPD